MRQFKISLILTLVIGTLLSGCNIYDPLDKPNGDEQLLSAARAYFDQGEFDKAAEMYAKISGNMADEVAVDSAFMILNEKGATMGEFMLAFGQGEGSMGVAFTKMANYMITHGGTPGVQKRLDILEAFQKVDQISASNVAAKGIVRFTTAVVLIAELLSEGAANGTFTAEDLAAAAPTCAALQPGLCAAPAASCALKANFSNLVGDITLPTSGQANMDGAKPDLYVINAALKEINKALNQEIMGSGKLGGSLSGFSTELLSAFSSGLGGNANCGVWALLDLGIGSTK